MLVPMPRDSFVITSETRVIPKMVQQALSNKPITIYGNGYGNYMLDPTKNICPADMSRAICREGYYNTRSLYGLNTGCRPSWYDFRNGCTTHGGKLVDIVGNGCKPSLYRGICR